MLRIRVSISSSHTAQHTHHGPLGRRQHQSDGGERQEGRSPGPKDAQKAKEQEKKDAAAWAVGSNQRGASKAQAAADKQAEKMRRDAEKKALEAEEDAAASKVMKPKKKKKDKDDVSALLMAGLDGGKKKKKPVVVPSRPRRRSRLRCGWPRRRRCAKKAWCCRMTTC